MTIIDKENRLDHFLKKHQPVPPPASSCEKQRIRAALQKSETVWSLALKWFVPGFVTVSLLYALMVIGISWQTTQPNPDREALNNFLWQTVGVTVEDEESGFNQAGDEWLALVNYFEIKNH